MLFDNLHWIDPSSREFLDRLIERLANWPVLLLTIFPPEFQPPWTGQPHVMTLTLPRLDRRDTAEMVAHIAGNWKLPLETVEEISERTDGVPLFVEELTKAVLESGVHGAAVLSSAPQQTLSVPATLHASLMGRLDRLGPRAKEVAQTGAAIGREFGYRLLASTIDLPEPELLQALDRLTTSGLLFSRGTPPQSNYTFKHALVQDATYGTLLHGRRQQMHLRLVATLEDRFPEIVSAQPALLAQHCATAGLTEKAADYCLKAGHQAVVSSAMTEAITQLRKGLGLPDCPARQQQELDLRIVFSRALMAVRGFSAADVDENPAQAQALAEQLNRANDLVPLMSHNWMFRLGRSEHRLGLRLIEQIELIGESQNDDYTKCMLCSMRGTTFYYLGNFVAARAHLEQSVGYADLSRPGLRGVELWAAVLSFLALSLAILGYIEQGRSQMEQALSQARRRGHVLTLVYVLQFSTLFAGLIRSPTAHIEELLALSTEHGLQHYLVTGMVCRGRSLVVIGRAQEGLALLKQGWLAELNRIGLVLGMSSLLTWFAEAHVMLGQHAEALNCLAEAARTVETTDERVNEASLHRVWVDLLNSKGDQPAAEDHYRQAIAVAERQSARLFQVRASVSLALLWRDQGKRAEARDLLGPIYQWFTEGFDAPDLRDAKALLDELA
jgi:tetratricopeptide (TPR) repeat protein